MGHAGRRGGVRQQPGRRRLTLAAVAARGDARRVRVVGQAGHAHGAIGRARSETARGAFGPVVAADLDRDRVADGWVVGVATETSVGRGARGAAGSAASAPCAACGGPAGLEAAPGGRHATEPGSATCGVLLPTRSHRAPGRRSGTGRATRRAQVRTRDRLPTTSRAPDHARQNHPPHAHQGNPGVGAALLGGGAGLGEHTALRAATTPPSPSRDTTERRRA